MVTATLEVTVFNPDNGANLNRIIEIHSEVLPDSFVVRMGPIFMRKFYYSALTRIGFLKVYLAHYHGEVVGILVTNRKPFSLIRSALKEYFFTFVWAVGLSLLTNPLRLSTLIETARYKPDPLLKAYEDEGKSFEILTIGVVEAHRKLVVNNLKVAHHMLRRVVDDYAAEGFTRVTGQILKSNQMALKFYAKYNADYPQSSVREHAVIMDVPVANVKI